MTRYRGLFKGAGRGTFSLVGISGRVLSAGKFESSCGTVLAEQLPSKSLQKSLLNLLVIPVILYMQGDGTDCMN